MDFVKSSFQNYQKQAKTNGAHIGHASAGGITVSNSGEIEA